MTNSPIQNIFIVGDEWLYYKIYCGVKTADSLLIDVIDPLCNELLEKELIDKWFFIRYSDPNSHIRIRFHSTQADNLFIIITKMKMLIKPYIISKQVWDITLATYQREIERYGKCTIGDSETFFFYDSQNSIAIIKNAVDDTARFLMVFRWLEYLISSFKLNTQDQLYFLEHMASSFKKEFEVHNTVTKKLNIKYKNLENLLYSDFKEKKIINLELKKIINNLILLNKRQMLEVSLTDLLSSYIHMSINRSFRSKQRLYEMMIYDFLNKKNKSKYARYGEL